MKIFPGGQNVILHILQILFKYNVHHIRKHNQACKNPIQERELPQTSDKRKRSSATPELPGIDLLYSCNLKRSPKILYT